MAIYYSNAEWSKTGKSQDRHTSCAMAFAICELLIRNYGRNEECETRGKCLRTWVTDDKGNVVESKVTLERERDL